MKKTILIIVSVVLALALVGTGAFLYFKNATHRPFKNLKTQDVISITVDLNYFGVSYSAEKENKDQIVSFLNQIEIPYFESKSDVIYIGSAPNFTVLLKNGTYFTFLCHNYNEPLNSDPVEAQFFYNNKKYDTKSREAVKGLSRIGNIMYAKGIFYTDKFDESDYTPQELEELGLK